MLLWPVNYLTHDDHTKRIELRLSSSCKPSLPYTSKLILTDHRSAEYDCSSHGFATRCHYWCSLCHGERL